MCSRWFLPVLLVGKVYGYGKSFSPLLWTWGSSSSKMDGFGKFNEEVLQNNLSGSHCSTVERLYAWEKKLYSEVKVLYYLKTLALIFPVLLDITGVSI